MPETSSGNGRAPDDAAAAIRPSEGQPENTLAFAAQYMAERHPTAANSQPTAADNLVPASSLLSPAEKKGTEAAPPLLATAEDVTLLDDPSLQLVMRFLVGSAIVGVEELLTRVRGWDEKARTDPAARSGKAFDEATDLELARYLVIGSLVWGRRWLVRTVRTNVVGLPGKRSPLLQSVDRISRIWPLSSFRAPLQHALADLSTSASERMREGWQEELAARWLAQQTIQEIIDDFIDHLSENEALATLVRDQLNQQSLGLASTVRDTGRQWSVVGDDVVEGVVRRLFRLKPRSELPGSVVVPAQPGAEDGRGGK